MMSRWKRIGFFWFRGICFLLILGVMLSYALYVLTPKHDYGICSITNLYYQGQNTVDVLVIGTSAAQASINPAILWDEYGIASYNLCSAELPYWASYFYLKEAIKDQSPKLLILDAKPSIYTLPYSRKGRVVLSTYGLRSLENRVGSIIASTHPDNTVKFLLGFPVIHNNYQTLTLDDFSYPPDNGGRGSDWKGFTPYEEALDFEAPWGDVSSDKTTPIADKQKEYFEKLLQLAQDEGIGVLVIGFPTPDYVYDHPYFNTLLSITENYGAAFLNYNHPNIADMWDYTVDFADWQHLNIRGSTKLSKHLGAYLTEQFNLPDRRNQIGYESYENQSNKWQQYSNHPLLQEMDH